MQKFFPLLVLLVVVSYALYNATLRNKKIYKEPSGTTYKKNIQTHNISHAQEELESIFSDEYLKQYIIDVINHGSTQLHFKKNEVMEAGFAPSEDAEKIACYVMEFSEKKCKKPYPKETVGYYTSICGGCHGNNGKGTSGAYPDLSRDPLLGIQAKEERLKRILN